MMAFSLSQPTVGLVIGADAVELVQLAPGSGKPKVIHAVRIPMANGSSTAAPEQTDAGSAPAAKDARVVEAIRSALAASSVEQGAFRVRASDERNPSQAFYWEVKAVRADVLPLDVELDQRALLPSGALEASPAGSKEASRS